MYTVTMLKPMKVCFIVFCILSYIQLPVSSNQNDIDPFDMLNFDQSTMKMKNIEEMKDTMDTNDKQFDKVKVSSTPSPMVEIPPETINLDEKTKPKMDITKCPIRLSQASTLFKQFVKTLLYHIKDTVYSGGFGEYNLRLILTTDDVDNLLKYGNSETEVDLHTAHQILNKMISNFRKVSMDDKSSRLLWIEDKLGISIANLVQVSILVFLMLCSSTLLMYLKITFKKFITYLFICIFIGSIILTWYSLYMKEVTKQHYAMIKDMPDHCKNRKNKDAGFIAVTFSWISSPFTFRIDECQEYFEHLLIDPLVKVSPMEAVAVTLTRFVLIPLRHIAEELSISFRMFFKDLPVQLWPIAIGGISLFGFLLLFMGFGYRISLPFGLIAVEPGQRIGKNELKALEERHRDEMQRANKLILDNQENTLNRLNKYFEGYPAMDSINSSGDGIANGHHNKYNNTNLHKKNTGNTISDASESGHIEVVKHVDNETPLPIQVKEELEKDFYEINAFKPSAIPVLNSAESPLKIKDNIANIGSIN